MNRIVIRFDYLHGPIWKDCVNIETGDLSTGVDLVDNDIVLQALDDKAGELYSSLYLFDKEEACSFDNQKYIALKPQFLDLINAIKSRLQQINDGSFDVIDEETERLKIADSIAS